MPEETKSPQPEPWLRGTASTLPPVQRALLHALELAQEDIAKWCGGLTEAELEARPFSLPSIAFQVRHIARSLDRFFSYAEGRELTAEQRAALAREMNAQGGREELWGEFDESITTSTRQLAATVDKPLEMPIKIGRKGLPTTLGGLLIHAAEHTQRHVGQAITTAKVLVAQRNRFVKLEERDSENIK